MSFLFFFALLLCWGRSYYSFLFPTLTKPFILPQRKGHLLYSSVKAYDSNSKEPLFKFGVIADIQYVNAPDSPNYQQTRVRRYNQSLKIFDEAIRSWDEVDGLSFSLILGDIIDGKSATVSKPT